MASEGEVPGKTFHIKVITDADAEKGRPGDI